MATVTIARPDVFPDGTSIRADVNPKRFPLPGDTDAPLGSGLATATVASGTAALTGLADGVDYVISGQVGGRWRRLYMRTTETATGLAGVTTAVTQPNGLPHPKLRQRRRALGLV